MDLIKKILVKWQIWNKKITAKINYWSIVKSKNISIDPSSVIHPTALIEIINGGSIQIGKNCRIGEYVIIQTYGGNIKIGNSCNINPFTIIYGHGDTEIGENVLIAGQCMIIPSNHNFEKLDIPIAQQGETSEKITIEDDVWIGNGCSVLNGVTIKKGAIVAAGAVVNKDVDAFTLVKGVPAKPFKKRT